MAPNKRPSLADAFGGLDIQSSSPNRSLTHAGPQGFNLSESIRKKLFSTWRARPLVQGPSIQGPSIQGQDRRHHEASFTIAMDEAYDYNVLGDDLDPDVLHEEFRKYGHELSQMIQSLSPEDDMNEIDDHLVDMLSRMVFSSNMIENAGGGLDITIKLCAAIFRGEAVSDETPERDPDYEAMKRDLMRRNLPHGTAAVLRSRREIVQHAKATKFIITQLYLSDKDLTEDIILETHRILTYKVDTEDGTSWTQYSGNYRQWSVRCGFHVFMQPSAVPGSMKEFVKELKIDLSKAVQSGEIDPVALAAKYCHKFVNIHPFLDGNGRTCRLILNALLLKYGGVLVCLGEQGDDRDRYLTIASQASYSEASEPEEMKDLPDELKQKHYKGLASLTLKHARDSMRRVVGLIKRKGNAKDGKVEQE